MKESFVVYIAFVVILTPGATAPGEAAQTGSTGLSFLKVGVGARALGMGEAYSAIASDPSGTYYNPAALSSAATPQLMLMHKEWIQGTRTEYIAANSSLGSLTLGISANTTSVNDIELRTIPGPPLSTFDARNVALGLSAAYAVDSFLGVGATAKYLYEKILVYDAAGLAFDIGARYKTPWNVNVAIALNNLGSMSQLENTSSELPTLFRFGASYIADLQHIDGSLILSSDIVSFTRESKTHLHVGAEINYSHAVALRAGYQTGYDAKNFSAGIGLYYGIVQMDYAFVPFRYELGTAHTFSLLLRFE